MPVRKRRQQQLSALSSASNSVLKEMNSKKGNKTRVRQREVEDENSSNTAKRWQRKVAISASILLVTILAVFLALSLSSRNNNSCIPAAATSASTTPSGVVGNANTVPRDDNGSKSIANDKSASSRTIPEGSD